MKTSNEEWQATGKQNANIYFALFVAGGLAGLLQMSSPVKFGLGFEMVALGRNLAETGSYANPFLVLNTGPTAANPPVYPVFLALLTKVLRSTDPVVLAATVSSMVANAFTASWLPRVSGVFYGDIKPGIVAAILWLASAQLMPSWDASFTVAGLLLFCLLSAHLRTRKGVVPAVVTGAIAGLLFGLNPSSLLITLPWIAYLMLSRRVLWRQTAVVLATLFLLMFLWAARNYAQLGAFVVRTNLGMTLYSSDNDCAQPSMIADEANNCFQSHHPNMSLSEAQLLLKLGEVTYDRKRTADAETWIKTHPERFRQLTLARFRDFWFPPVEESAFKVHVIWAITILSIPGLIWMLFRRERVSVFVLLVLFLYPLMYYVVVSDVRYRYPVLWLSELPAGYFLWRTYAYLLVRRQR